MRIALFVVATVLLVGASTSDAAQRRGEDRYDIRSDRDRYEDRRETRTNDRREDARSDRLDVRGDIHIVFSTGDRSVVREHYRPSYRRLPPGLQKKYHRAGYLPRGWERRMEPLPWALERRLGPVPREYHRGVIDDHVVIYAPRTGLIIDATVIF